jgi:hypothetical protein
LHEVSLRTPRPQRASRSNLRPESVLVLRNCYVAWLAAL